MNRTLWGVLLMFVSVLDGAQERTVRVRLFWQHPPAELRITPQGASLQRCHNCTPIPLIEARLIAARGAEVVVGSTTATAVILKGRARISGEGLSAFMVDNELQLQAHEGFLLLTLKMPLEQYVAA